MNKCEIKGTISKYKDFGKVTKCIVCTGEDKYKVYHNVVCFDSKLKGFGDGEIIHLKGNYANNNYEHNGVKQYGMQFVVKEVIQTKEEKDEDISDNIPF